MGILDERLFGPEGYGDAGRGGLLGSLPPWLYAAQQLGLPPAWDNMPATAWPAFAAALPGDPAANRPPVPAPGAAAASNMSGPPLPAPNAPAAPAAGDPL